MGEEPSSNGAVPAPSSASGHQRCRFNLAPPRHFLYPALLLLLAEEPRHGYRLVDAVLRLGFGPVDRPSVYRALADLEADGLLESWPMDAPAGGSTRHVYGMTTSGEQQLSRWMHVLVEGRVALDHVLDRYGAVVDAPISSNGHRVAGPTA